ncbi:hypothetical protein R83H12_01726 [Fibrobacteria bacterium R8-3-H12]
MNKAKLTSEDVWAMFAETDRRFKETDRQFKETDRQFKETDRQFKETDRQFKETDRQFKETDRKLKELGIHVSGISDSNGKFAEELFYDSLESSKTFAGVHFDAISNVFGGTERMPDGTMLQDQFDIVMINDDAVAIIEIKYKADSDYPEKMAKKKVNNFRVLFPKYSNYKIYLGLGSLVFEKRVVDEAKKHGVGLLKQKGNTIEYKTDWVRAY